MMFAGVPLMTGAVRSSQTVAPLSDDSPVGHGVADVDPGFGTYVPAGASVQLTAPGAAENAPAGHGVDDVAPEFGTNEPAGACVHVASDGFAR
jgi:hypothetical protein